MKTAIANDPRRKHQAEGNESSIYQLDSFLPRPSNIAQQKTSDRRTGNHVVYGKLSILAHQQSYKVSLAKLTELNFCLSLHYERRKLPTSYQKETRKLE